ncbi:MAG: hypothetical protein A2Y81_02430 [Nitrospirae bacterium RBG_13_43_8]|nr:MAG: hypothetical protein A2Y81_02430 [Nitrospirae bacterium RBG_13_43_8]
MRKFEVILLSVLLSVSSSLGVGCKKAEKPPETPRQAQRPVPITSAHPSEWKHMVTFDEEDFYVGSESVRYDDSIVTFSYMRIGREGEVDVARCSIDCNRGTVDFGERREHPLDGIGAKSEGGTGSHWSRIKPDSAWSGFRKSLCKDIASSEARLPETPTATRNVEKKSKELARSEVLPAKRPTPSVERKNKEFGRLESAPAKQAMPDIGRKRSELARLEPAAPEERPDTEKGIYFNRYTEVTGMSPGAAEGLIHTGRESRAWYEKSRVSSPLTDRELQAINDTLARTELQIACSIANSILPDKPEKTLTLSDLKGKGFIPSEGIKLRIDNGTKESLRISAKHNKGTKLFVADSNCHVTEEVQH